MSALSSVLVKFSADISQLQSAMREGLRDVQNVGNQMDAAGAGMGGVFSKLKGVALPVMATIGAGAIAMGAGIKKGLEFDAEMEQARNSFETLLGSADKAKTMVQNLQNFAATTPFEFPGIQNSAKLMLAMGFNAQSILPNLKAVGNAVAAVGGSEEQLNGVTMALGQMLTKGKVSAEEMNQLAERGIPAWDLMASKMGMSKAQLMQLSAQGKIMADQAIPALLSALGEKFDGAMAKQSKSWNGLISTLKDNFNIILGSAVSGLFEKLKPLMGLITEFTGKVVDAIQQGKGLKGIIESAFPPSLAAAILTVSNAISGLFNFIRQNWAIIQPILVGFVAGIAAWLVITQYASAIALAVKGIGLAFTAVQAVITGFGTAIAFLSSPVGIAVVAIGALVAIGYTLYKNWDTVKGQLLAVWNAIKEATRPLWQPIADTIKFVMNEIINFIKPILETLKTWFGMYFEVYFKVVSTVLGQIANVFKFQFDLIKNTVSFVLGVLKDLFTINLQIIWTLTTTHLKNVLEVFKAAFGTLMAFLRAWWETVKTLFSAAFMTIYYLCTGQWGKIGDVWKNAGERMKGIVTELWNRIKELWTNAFSNIVSNTIAGAGKIGNAITDLKNSLAKRFSEMVSNAIDAGKNLIKGFLNGVLSLGSWLRNKIASFFRENVIGTAKKILGIHSPSRVMKAFGQFSAQGFAIGIEKDSGKAVNSATAMAKGVISAVRGNSGLTLGYNVGVNGRTYSGQFTAQISKAPAPAVAGGDIHIAQLVVREEADIEKIAEALYRLQKRGQRSKGVM